MEYITIYKGGDDFLRRPSVIFLLALTAGIWWRLTDLAPALYVSLIVILSLLFEPKMKKCVLVAIGLSIGIGLTHVQQSKLEQKSEMFDDNEPIQVSGMLVQKDFLDSASCWLKTDDGFWLRLKFSNYKPMPKLNSGMNVTVSGKYAEPVPARNPGGFNEKRWLYAKNAIGTVTVTQIKQSKGGSFIEQWRHTIGKPLVNSLLQNTAFKQGPMASGMLFGEDSWIPPEVIEAYKKSGTNHILSVSGAHFGVLLFWIYKFFEHRSVAYKHKKLFIWGFLGIFIWLIGADSAAVRAYYMFLLLDLSRLSYKQPDALNCLNLTAIFMLLHNPMMIWDIGLQLAFGAIYGLLVIAPFLRGTFSTNDNKLINGLIDSLILSLSVCLCLYPILCTQFNNFTWLSLLFNIPVSLLSAISLPLCSGVALLWWCKPIARGIGLANGASIWLMTEVVKTSLLLPASKACHRFNLLYM